MKDSTRTMIGAGSALGLVISILVMLDNPRGSLPLPYTVVLVSFMLACMLGFVYSIAKKPSDIAEAPLFQPELEPEEVYTSRH